MWLNMLRIDSLGHRQYGQTPTVSQILETAATGLPREFAVSRPQLLANAFSQCYPSSFFTVELTSHTLTCATNLNSCFTRSTPV